MQGLAKSWGKSEEIEEKNDREEPDFPPSWTGLVLCHFLFISSHSSFQPCLISVLNDCSIHCIIFCSALIVLRCLFFYFLNSHVFCCKFGVGKETVLNEILSVHFTPLLHLYSLCHLFGTNKLCVSASHSAFLFLLISIASPYFFSVLGCLPCALRSRMRVCRTYGLEVGEPGYVRLVCVWILYWLFIPSLLQIPHVQCCEYIPSQHLPTPLAC